MAPKRRSEKERGSERGGRVERKGIKGKKRGTVATTKIERIKAEKWRKGDIEESIYRTGQKEGGRERQRERE